MSTRLFVGNLPFSATEDDLRGLFSNGGFEPQDVHIVTDRDSGRPRGFGFVEVGSPEAAQNAIEQLDGTMMEGRALRISEARERKQRF